MRRIIKIFWKFTLLYFAILISYLLFSVAAAKFQFIARIDTWIDPPEFVFWQAGELYANPPIFNTVMSDPDNLLSDREPTEFSDIDIWVVLLDGTPEIEEFQFANALGLDTASIANSDGSDLQQFISMGIFTRVHVLPLFVKRKNVIVVDARKWWNIYKTECLDELIYDVMSGRRTPDLWDACKKE